MILGSAWPLVLDYQRRRGWAWHDRGVLALEQWRGRQRVGSVSPRAHRFTFQHKERRARDGGATCFEGAPLNEAESELGSLLNAATPQVNSPLCRAAGTASLRAGPRYQAPATVTCAPTHASNPASFTECCGAWLGGYSLFTRRLSGGLPCCTSGTVPPK